MIDRRIAVAWCLGTLLCVGDASAQPAADPPPAPDASAALAYEPAPAPSAALAYEPAYQPPPAEAPVKAPARRLLRSAFGSFDVGVPLVLDVDRTLIRPGAGLHARGGMDFGYFGFLFHGGYRGIPVDLESYAEHGHPEYTNEGRDPLTNIFFGFGVLGQYPNRSRFRPYASASFDFNFWHFREGAVGCGGYYYWYCDTYAVYKFAPGFTGRLGTAVELAGAVYLDVGLALSMTFAGKFFYENESWLEPFAGIGYRY